MLPTIEDRQVVLIHKKRQPNRYQPDRFRTGRKIFDQESDWCRGFFVRTQERLLIGAEILICFHLRSL